MARQCPDHAGHGVDIDRRLAQVECGFRYRIDPADIGAEHENPRHRHQQARDGERQQRQIVKQRAARRVGTLDRPGDEAADEEGHQRSAERVDHRIGEQPQDARRGIGFDEIIEREGAEAKPGIFGERGDEQRRDRHQYQPGTDGDADDQQDVRLAPARSGFACRLQFCSGHARCYISFAAHVMPREGGAPSKRRPMSFGRLAPRLLDHPPSRMMTVRG